MKLTTLQGNPITGWVTKSVGARKLGIRPYDIFVTRLSVSQRTNKVLTFEVYTNFKIDRRSNTIEIDPDSRFDFNPNDVVITPAIQAWLHSNGWHMP